GAPPAAEGGLLPAGGPGRQLVAAGGRGEPRDASPVGVHHENVEILQGGVLNVTRAGKGDPLSVLRPGGGPLEARGVREPGDPRAAGVPHVDVAQRVIAITPEDDPLSVWRQRGFPVESGRIRQARDTGAV